MIALDWFSVPGAVVLLASVASAQTLQFVQSQLRAPAPLATASLYPQGLLTAGDYNRDGMLDVVLVDQAAIEVLTGRADGSFASNHFYASLADREPVLRDIDGDGWPELLLLPVALPYGVGPSLARNVRGTFQPVDLPGAHWATAGVLDDIDGDGDLDMVLTEQINVGSSIYLLRNGGNLQFTTEVAPFPSGLPLFRSLALLDYDADGDRDLLLIPGSIFGASTGPLVLLRNDGGNYTNVSSMLPAIRTGTTCACGGDFDGDGYLDIALGRADDGLDMLWGGASGFTAQVMVASPGPTTSLTAVDYDGDGRTDLAWMQYGHVGPNTENRIGTLHSEPARTFRSVFHLDNAAGSAGIIDIDGDGILDFLHSPRLSSDLCVRRRVGTWLEDAAFASGIRLLDSIFSYAEPRAGDLDGDGRADLLMATQPTMQVLLGLGDNRYQDALTTNVPTNTEPPTRKLVDLDNDGDIDLVTADSANVRAYRNNGTGQFALIADRAMPSTGIDTLRIFDVDGDGDLDVVRASTTGVALLENLGVTFTATPVALTTGSSNEVLECADIDNDGDLDLITGRMTTGGHLVLINTGGGVFVPGAPSMLGLGVTPTSVRAGDFDGDGNVDLVVATNGMVRLKHNTGSGTFVDTTNASGLSLSPTTLSNLLVGDFDDDGDLDVFGISTLAPILLDNQGNGTFVDVGSARVQGVNTFTLPRWTVDAADVDDDGDLDLLVNSGNHSTIAPQNWILTNHRRQLTSRQAPRLGRSAEFAIHAGPGVGAAGVAWLFAGSLTPAPQRLPFLLGRIQIDAASLVQVDSVMTSAVGPSTSFLTVPNQAALLGLELTFQAAILPTNGTAGVTSAVFERILP